MNGLMIGKDWLRNILVLPVYLFQPRVEATSDNLPVGYQEDGSTPLLGLPDENHVQGSYCNVSKRAIPGTETDIGCDCVTGSLLLLVGMAKPVALRWPLILESLKLPSILQILQSSFISNCNCVCIDYECAN